MRLKYFAGVAAGMLVFASAQAQQASGNIMGDGKSGDTVVVDGPAIGFHREVTLDKDGRYQVRRVPIGSYNVTVRHADGTTEEPKAVRVQAGTTARVQ
jgi:hypothetical protein